LTITMFHLSKGSICRWRSQTPQDAPLRHALTTLALAVPMYSRVRSTPLDSLWDARATVKSIPTQPTHRAVAQDLIAPRTPARILECLIIPTSSRTAPMHTRMHTTNRAGLRFGPARRRPMQIIRSPSVPESSMHRSIFVWKERNPCFRSVCTVVMAAQRGLSHYSKF